MIEELLTNPWLASLAIVIGFVLLLKGADWLVDGASSVAKRMGVSTLVIGLTVVAFGTSMPEFVVNMVAASAHNTEIAITNILGSNSMNVFVILGLSAVICPITSQRSSRRFDIPYTVIGGLLVLLFAVYTRPMAAGEWGSIHLDEGYITGIGGAVLLALFVLFMWHTFRISKNQPAGEEEEKKPMAMWKAIVLILVGLVSLVLGGEMIVRSATNIARMLGVSDAIIGLTVVALGTSLPELATSCIAAAKKDVDLALGNVLGSNIFNIFFILGASACVCPLPTYEGLWLDSAMVALSGIMLMGFVYINRRHEITRWNGALLLLVYAAYLTYRLMSI